MEKILTYIYDQFSLMMVLKQVFNWDYDNLDEKSIEKAFLFDKLDFIFICGDLKKVFLEKI
jgi:hypothetical protein